jgi:hypothetical protein
MRLQFKEEPKEWRKAAWLGALGLALLSTILRWRRVLPAAVWAAVLAVLGLTALCAWLRPGWFRGYYRFSNRLAFYLTKVLGCLVLALLFLLVVTPLGVILRLMGKDLLQTKGWRTAPSAWQRAGESTPLERLF